MIKDKFASLQDARQALETELLSLKDWYYCDVTWTVLRSRSTFVTIFPDGVVKCGGSREHISLETTREIFERAQKCELLERKVQALRDLATKTLDPGEYISAVVRVLKGGNK